MRSVLFLSVAVIVVDLIGADVYLHSPRGSNDRLNEKSANRKNANRVFDSQNNNRGGYNVGDKTASPAGSNEENQYSMQFFQSGPKHKGKGNEGKSLLTIEWTNQHGCGGSEDKDPHKLNCNLVLQYMCEPVDVAIPKKHHIRNGVKTNTQEYANREFKNNNEKQNRKNADVVDNRAIQEPWEWYDKCNKRQRNKGLFTADQKLRGQSSRYTRQNPGGTQYGYECPEERDYYPYWHPTDWKDIAVLVHDEKLCKDYYEKESFNVKPKGECMEKYADGNYKHASMYNQNKTCVENGGTWIEFSNYLEEATSYKTKERCEQESTEDIPLIWAIPYRTQDLDTKEKCLVALDKPQCELAPWSRDNHLGNGRDGVPLNYTWVLPHFPSKKDQRCIFRVRYNISTDDYDPFNTNSSHNQNLAGMVISPVQQNDLIDIGAAQTPLRLAINTAQYGRTFQDRSHVIILKKRPGEINDTDTIYNLNVRGKRGNIVQVYPAVEYDFIPNKLTLKENEFVHIQWTGSNTHNNGNPAGDGQAGDAGEGRQGTDRNNIVEVLDPIDNYPVPFENSTMFTGATVVWSSDPQTQNAKDAAVSLASVGYYACLTSCKNSPKRKKPTVNNLLNNAAASYPGIVLQFSKGEYHYICSRNNNFSNRSQKGMITVLKGEQP